MKKVLIPALKAVTPRSGAYSQQVLQGLKIRYWTTDLIVTII
jgi:hypothetical protein